MTICKFFIQGTCRFGNKCWYEHPSAGNTGAQRHLNFSNFGDNNQGDGGGGGGFQTSRQGNQQQQQQQQQTKYKWTAPHLSFGSNNSASQQQQQQQLQSPQEIISGLSREITTWESSKMWLLSCVSFQKSGPSIPGMTDMSPEELRFEAYESQKTKSFNDYIHKVQQMHNEYSAKRQELKSPSTQLRDKLIEFIETSRKQQPGNSSSRFSGSGGSAFGSSSAFGQGAAFASETSKVFGNSASNLFGKSETPSNPFASQGNAFGALSSGSAFGYPNPAQSSGTNVFGNSGSTAFGGQMGPCVSNVFGSTPNQGLVSQSMNPASSGSVFGAQGSSSPAQTSAFGAQGSSSPSQTSAFGGATSVFGSPAAASGSSPAAGLFGKPAAPASVFGQQSILGSGMVAPNTASAFGSVSVGGSVFGQASPVPDVSPSMYTPMASLTVAELEQYQAQKFTLGKIPTRPPPKELCF